MKCHFSGEKGQQTVGNLLSAIIHSFESKHASTSIRKQNKMESTINLLKAHINRFIRKPDTQHGALAS